MMDEVPGDVALDAFWKATWSLSMASIGHPRRVSSELAYACLRQLARRDDATGRRAADYLGLGPRKVNGIWMEI